MDIFALLEKKANNTSALSIGICSVTTQAHSDMRLALLVLPTLLSCCISLQGANFSNKFYYEGSFDQLRKQAFEEAKPYILFFAFEGHPDTKAFEERTFRDQALSDLIEEHFLIFKIDEHWEHQSERHPKVLFEVDKPGLMIFDEYSDNVLHIGGHMEAEDLRAELVNLIPKRGSENPPKALSSTSVKRLSEDFWEGGQSQDPESSTDNWNQSQGEDEIIIIDDLAEANAENNRLDFKESTTIWKRTPSIAESQSSSEEAIIQQSFDFEEKDNSEAYQNNTSISGSDDLREKLPLIEADWEEREAEPTKYDVSEEYLEQQNPPFEGYGIQTGAFEQSYFMRSQVEYLQANFSHDVYVQKSMDGGKTLYKVQVGPFTTERDARAFQRAYQNMSGKKGGFLVYLR